MIIFGDTKNDQIDDLYAEKIIKELRLQLGWEIKPGSVMHDHVRGFSKLYSKEQRDILEVVAIYRLAFKPGYPNDPYGGVV